jgi:ribosomal protein L15
MAKKLLHSSKITVNKADNTIIVGDIIPLESLLLITDVTANKVIYQFNDLTKGAIASIDGKGSSTTFTLTHDMANDPDIQNTNSIQLFYDSANS